MEYLSTEDRLKNILISDKQENSMRLENVLKSEIFYVLKDYLNLSLEDLSVVFGVGKDGKYRLDISANCNGIKVAKTFPIRM